MNSKTAYTRQRIWPYEQAGLLQQRVAIPEHNDLGQKLKNSYLLLDY